MHIDEIHSHFLWTRFYLKKKNNSTILFIPIRLISIILRSCTHNSRHAHTFKYTLTHTQTLMLSLHSLLFTEERPQYTPFTIRSTSLLSFLSLCIVHIYIYIFLHIRKRGALEKVFVSM